MKRLLLAFLAVPLVALADTFTVDNVAFQSSLSPYNWQTSGSSYVLAVNAGAYIKLGFTGTSLSFGVDVSGLSFDPNYPVIKYSVDGGAYTTTQLVSGQTSLSVATGLADSSHAVWLAYVGLDTTAASRWSGSLGFKITNIVVGSGKTISAGSFSPRNYFLAYGDSITEGWGVTTGANTALKQDASVGYQAILAQWMGVEYGDAAFAGEGWTTGTAGVPGLVTSYNLIYSGVSRNFSPAPGWVLVNMGTNQNPSSSTVVTWLGNLCSAIGANARIYLLIPFNQAAVTNLTSAYNTYVASNPSDKITKVDLGSTGSSIVTNHSSDGTHPNVAGHQLLAAQVWSAIATVPVPSGRRGVVHLPAQ